MNARHTRRLEIAGPRGVVPRSADVLQSLIYRVWAAGFELVIVLGLRAHLIPRSDVAEARRKQPPSLVAYQAELLAFADYLMNRDSFASFEKLEGIRYSLEDAFREGYFVIRMAPLDEAAEIAQSILRTSGGLQLRRRQANVIGSIVRCLHERAVQRLPR